MWRTEEEAFTGPAVQSCTATEAAGIGANPRRSPWGVWVPMVTPMRGGALDLAGAARLAEHYVEAGVNGLIILGTTGEGSLLSCRERQAFTAAVLEAVHGELPVMAGVGAVDTRAVCAQVAELDAFDLAGYLVPPPYYLRPSDEGLVWHFGEVARATGRPLMLYNVPKRTGCPMSPALIATLLAHPRIVAVKECDRAGLQASGSDPHVAVLCGEDAALLDHLLAGGAGIVAASAHIRPDLFVRLLQLAQTGRLRAARALFARLAPLVSLLFEEPNPAPVKAALALSGVIAPETRLPLQPASAALVHRLEHAMALLP
ncbi:4-hydroxy-tetrahydrodipicolinate synthase [Cupriavidus neocaledonicus]|uniref:4-hydroxy-tetrahydrodipicolinate synthase n=1 Tax=Cupriavidus neocaledonicus TaxID=1040979 RepID=A0A375HPP1_9BURK|nr:4-hydroxy-tetrahydrodipicolinate synthase [Cupriavidus neocaledonicus]SOZ39564.1 4-hydroxy-tetrahydrodipicolinate synthase [Cupriavidus neocaledonicus]SPD58720.1 4-hydroxy-tetrahydrodipicolinate synthase [Cupriavidus neocaledonicus]